MYVFNKITVKPQLPKSINRLDEIANNLWWSWNSEYLRLLKKIDRDLWETVEKNPVKFLKRVSQERLEMAAKDSSFVKEYEKVLKNYEDYMSSKDTWFSKKYPENKNDLIAYFSAEYGLDETIPIYSGGLGILSGDHLKSASDLGIPLVGVGLLYKNGYFHQKIEGYGIQKSEYKNIELDNMPIHPVPAGNDIFPTDLVERYFKEFWPKMSLEREDFLKLGMKPCDQLEPGFNMGILALKIAGKKNGVSKLHGEVSRELFGDVWPNIAANESPITYVTNGIHTCTWVPQNLKELYNKYLTSPTTPYWQDKIYLDETWKRIKNIPDEELWNAHLERKEKLIQIIKDNTTNRLRRAGVSYDEIKEMTSGVSSNDLIIGFARRFATYKRATLIFNDLERITEILNDSKHPVRLVFAGKAHPADKEGQDLIKFIHEISMKPQFRGKIFLLENYNIAMSRYLISGVDVWLNNPRRPMEASGTSGQKASVNGVINFSVLDGWWAEGYDQTNGWTIGTDKEYRSYAEQDIADSQSMYKTLETKIIPTFYNRPSENEPSEEWMKIMKQSIITTGGKYSTARMLVDYTNNLYIPLINLYNEHFSKLDEAAEFTSWKKHVKDNWDNILIEQTDNPENVRIDAGEAIEVGCKVTLPNLEKEDIRVEVYCGKISDEGRVENITVVPMKFVSEEKEYKRYTYTAKISLSTGGNYGYTFRVMPTNKMLLDSENLDLVKWITK